MEDLPDNTSLEVQIVERGKFDRGPNCRVLIASASNLPGASFGEKVPFGGVVGPERTGLFVAGHKATMSNGCRGEWRIEVGVLDRGDPFRVPQDGEHWPIQMIRQFGTIEPGPCIREGSALAADNGFCADFFEVKVERQ
jgi:hypothetical protein